MLTSRQIEHLAPSTRRVQGNPETHHGGGGGKRKENRTSIGKAPITAHFSLTGAQSHLLHPVLREAEIQLSYNPGRGKKDFR